MTDYLFIDTDRTRDAAGHLRTMHGSGEDLVSDIRIAASLAELADSIAADFDEVSEALAELATVLDQRSSLADNGHVITARSSAAQLAGISQVLWEYDTPTTDELFPEIGPRTTGILEARLDQNHPVHVDDEPGFFGWLGDRADDALDWVADQPIAPPSLNPIDIFNHAQDLEAGIVDFLQAPDLGPIDGTVDWYLDGFANPLLPPFVLSPLTPLFDYALDHGVVRGTASFGLFSVSLAATTIGDRPMVAWGGSLGPKGTPKAFASYTRSDTAPESGLSESFGICAGVCGGVTNTGGDVERWIGVGIPGLTAGTTYEQWIDVRDDE